MRGIFFYYFTHTAGLTAYVTTGAFRSGGQQHAGVNHQNKTSPYQIGTGMLLFCFAYALRTQGPGTARYRWVNSLCDHRRFPAACQRRLAA